MEEENTVIVLMENGRVVDVWGTQPCRVCVLVATPEQPAAAGARLAPQIDVCGQSWTVDFRELGPIREHRQPLRQLAVQHVIDLVHQTSTGAASATQRAEEPAHV